MEKISNVQRNKLYQKYKGKPKIKVTDFQSAREACEQQCGKNYRAELNRQVSERYFYNRYFDIEQNQSDRKIARNYEYIGKLIRGEVKPKCYKDKLRFMFLIKKKYGSVKNWHSTKMLLEND